MTERRRGPRRPGPLPVVLAALATFAAVLVLLAVQLRAGHDPALGARAVAAAAPPRQVIVHRIVRRRVIVTDDAPAPARATPAPPVAPAPVAPGPVAPAPAPAAPVAPAPAAPVTTRSS